MAPKDDTPARIRRVLAEAEHGGLGGMDSLLPGAAAGRGGWALALAAGAAFWGRTAREPDERDLEALVNAPFQDRQGAALACAHLQRLALLRFEGPRLAHLAALQGRLVGDEVMPDARLAADSAGLWSEVLQGRYEDFEAKGRALHTRALQAQAAGVVIEATLQRALAALAAGEHEAAVAHARRGSRMSRAEGLLTQEWLAHLVLARVRRVAGNPHLAAHILEALSRVVTNPWRGWLCWEQTLAGGVEASAATAAAVRQSGAAQTNAERAALGVIRMLTAAREGDRSTFTSAAAEAVAALNGFAALAEEATTLVGALDPSAPAPPLLDPWRRGETDAVPLGLSGLPPWPDDPAAPSRIDHALAFVAVEPGRPGKRVLRPGVAMLEGGREAEQAFAARRAGQRTDVALAALALAGPDGVDTDLFFRNVWGFPFVARLHQGTLDVTVFKMRKQLEGVGEVVRARHHIALRADRPLVLPDPRCARSTTEHVLRLLAHHGILRAMDAADLLGVSERTVQTALKQLASDGVCRIERSGREVRYRVQDTTFSVTTGFGV